MTISSAAVCLSVLLFRASAETAIMNILRHGEKCASSGDDLTDVGYARASYLARCMSSATPSTAMPFGKATAVMAGEGKHSLRPKETVTPLAKNLDVTLNMPCSKEDADCFAENAVKYLTDKGTLVVAWAHESIPPLIKALEIPDVPSQYKEWPNACTSNTFTEPECCSEDGDSTCYDMIWQIKFTRSSGDGSTLSLASRRRRRKSDGSWQPQSITTLSEGFGGNASSPCVQDLSPTNQQVVV